MTKFYEIPLLWGLGDGTQDFPSCRNGRTFSLPNNVDDALSIIVDIHVASQGLYMALIRNHEGYVTGI